MKIHNKILRATLLIGCLLLLARLGVVFRDLVVAQRFGRADEVEAFVIAYVLPAFVASVVAKSFGAAFVPTYLQVRDSQGRPAAELLLCSVIGWSLLALSAVLAALAALAPWYLPFLASNFDETKLLLTQRLLYALVPFAVLNGLSAMWSVVLNAEEKFALPALTTVLEPLTALLALMVAGQALGIFALVAGTVIGAGLQALWLAFSVNRMGLPLRPRLLAADANSSQVLSQYVPMLVAAVIISTTTLLDHAMAAALEPGSVAALSYGRKVVDLLAGVGTIALGTVIFPHFSQLVARQDWHRCRQALKAYSAVIFLALIPVTAILVYSSPSIIALLFERGSFTSADTLIVADVQMLYAVQIPFYIAAVVGIRMISALRRNRFLVWVNLFSLILKLGLNLLFMRWLGVAGIALATSVVYLISTITIFVYLRSVLPREAR